jgi:hypothetical protein
MSITTNARIRLLLLPVFAIALAPAAFAATVVIPAAQEFVAGNEANAFPFGKTAASNEPYRYQQVYNASGFGEQAEPITIDEIRFRPDGNNQFLTGITVDSIEVRLSTTSTAADGLDNVDFDNNIGPDATLVYSGSLLWPIPSAGSPRPFELPITLTAPFVYDPSAGNLLLEVYNLSETFPLEYLLDTQNTPGDAISRVVEVVIPSSGEHEIPPVGTGSRGLITQFVYTAPEPASIGAGVAALFALATLRRSRIA